MSDYSELKRLAEAATPGPWRCGKTGDAVVAESQAGHSANAGHIAYYGGHLVAESISNRNRDFIAAANPAAVLALIAENEQAEENNVIWKGGISALGGALKKLTFCARTVTDGPDHALISACDEAENALSLIGVSRAIDYIEGLKAENKELQEKYEAARDRKNSITALRKEVEALRKDAELHVQIQRAAAELPTGWEIRVCVEHESGYVELWDEDGCEVDFPNSCETLGLTVSDAIDAAMGKESGQ